MKTFFYSLILGFFFVSSAQSKEVAVTMHQLTTNGVGDAIGVIVVTETGTGLRLAPYLTNMQPGAFSLTINENVGCHSLMSATGFSTPGMAAGNSMWTLPEIKVAADGMATSPVEIRNVSLNDVSKRTLVISHKSGSNTSFSGGGQRIACGSLELY